MDADSVVADLLLEWEESDSSGEPATPEILCRDHPECVDELRRRIELLRRVEPLISLAPPTEDEPPTIPGFEILGKLGDGGMGIVYHARELALDRFVAIKIPKAPVAINKPFRARFEREAKFLAQMRHAHIVPIYRADTINGVPYFVMEYESGGTLAQRRDEFAPHPARAAQMMEKVARAVAYAHEHSVRHRDLKPANIFLSQEGEPLVGDFGVATLVEADDRVRPREPIVGTPATEGAVATKPLTRAGTTAGTPAYMAPEQLAPVAQRVDDRADIWALGVILYELLTGRTPYQAKDPQTLYQEINQAPAPAPRRLNRRVDRGLDAIVRRCLEADPNKRFPNANALADRLARWVKWRARRRWRWAAAAGIVIAVMVASAVSPWGRGAVKTAIYRVRTRDITASLERGEPVTLIGENGFPTAYLIRTGAIHAGVSRSRDGFFTVKAEDIALVEMINDPQMESFRVSMDLRHDSVGSDSYAGVYFSDNVYRTSRGENHMIRCVLMDLKLPSREVPPGFNTLTPWLIFYNEAPRPAWRLDTMTGPFVKYPAPMDWSSVWHHLLIDVTSNAFVGEIDGLRSKPFFEDLYRKAFTTGYPNRCPDLQNVQLYQGHHGGLGLFVKNTALTVRNFRIEPLPEGNTQTQEAP